MWALMVFIVWRLVDKARCTDLTRLNRLKCIAAKPQTLQSTTLLILHIYTNIWHTRNETMILQLHTHLKRIRNKTKITTSSSNTHHKEYTQKAKTHTYTSIHTTHIKTHTPHTSKHTKTHTHYTTITAYLSTRKINKQ